MQTKTAELTAGKCVSCKTWFSRIRANALMVEYGQIYVEVCPYCAEDYYPEAVIFNG
jgi:hypothetical protein